MGWRHDTFYTLVIRTQDGSTNDALALLKDIPLDETCKVSASACMACGTSADDSEVVQSGAMVKITFVTVHAKGWKSAVYDAAVAFLRKLPAAGGWKYGGIDAALFKMDGDCETAMRYGIDAWQDVEVFTEDEQAEREALAIAHWKSYAEGVRAERKHADTPDVILSKAAAIKAAMAKAEHG